MTNVIFKAISVVAVLLISASSYAGEPSCLAACSFGDGYDYRFACLKNAAVGTLIRQFDCDIDEQDGISVSCVEDQNGVLRDVTSGPIGDAKKQFYAWCGQNGLIPR